MNLEKKLYKSRKNKMLGGICGGIGEYFQIDPTLVRLGFIALCLLAGGGLIAYIIALIVVPEAPEGYNPTAEEAPKTDPAKAPDGEPEATDTNTEDSGDTPFDV